MITIKLINDKLHITITGIGEEFDEHLKVIKNLPVNMRTHQDKAWIVDPSMLDRILEEVPEIMINFETPPWKIKGLEPPTLEEIFGVPIDRIGRNYIKDIVKENAFQDIAACLLYYKKKYLLADSVGIGKTIESILAIAKGVELGTIRRSGNILILTKKTLVRNFAKEIADMSYFNPLCIKGTIKQRQKLWSKKDKYDAIVMSHERLLSEMDFEYMCQMDLDLIIVDEVHRFNSRTSKKFKKLEKLIKKYPNAMVFLLTATPITNDIEQIYNLMRLIAPHVLGLVKDFESRYIVKKLQKNKAGKCFPVTYPIMYRLAELHRRISPYILQRFPADVGLQLPPVNNVTYYVEMTEEQLKLTQKAWEDIKNLEDLLLELKSKGSTPEYIEKIENSIKSGFTFLRMVANGTLCLKNNKSYSKRMAGVKSWDCPKIELLSDVVEDIIKQGDKIVIHTDFKSNIPIITKELSKFTDILEIDGSKPDTCIKDVTLKCTSCNKFDKCVQRRKAEYLFKNDDRYGVIVMTSAGEEGLNLQNAKYQINYDPPWNPSSLEQRKGRIRRIGSKHKHVYVIDLISIDSIEETIYNSVLVKKTSRIEKVIRPSEEEIEYIRQLTKELSEKYHEQ